jgi:hypothetical protein
MQVATDPSYVAAFGVAGSSGLVMVLLDIQHYGMLAAQVFFGRWLAPLGYLAYRSGLFPKALGVVLVLATVSYLTDSLTAFLLPDLEQQIKPFLIVAPLFGEVWMVAYLLVKGVKSGRQADSAPVTGLVPVRPCCPVALSSDGRWHRGQRPSIIGSTDSVRTERFSGPSRSRLGTLSQPSARPQ